MAIFAIHTVFIARENILFLEEWIDYHIQIGFSKFYLYDNSEVTKGTGFHIKSAQFEPGKVNKYGINYQELVKLTDNEIQDVLLKIVEKYKGKIHLIKWSPRDSHGNILFNQADAHNHCLEKLKHDRIDWCANIDMDEYIVLKRDKTIQNYLKKINKFNIISCIRLPQIRFESRFSNMEKLVIEIDKTETNILPINHSPKNIYKVQNTTSLNIHNWVGTGSIHTSNLDSLWFNHYKLNELDNFRTIRNINDSIINTIKVNSKEYILKRD